MRVPKQPSIQSRRAFLATLPALPAIGALTGCTNTSDPNAIRLALNWKPDPQFGGFYAAPYSAHGLQTEILPGGAGTPTVQMIGAGSAEFGIVSGDELVIARSRGNDVVALFAVFQTNPQGIMVHAERGLTSLEQVTQSGTLAIQRGLPYARLLEARYGFDNVQVVPSPGGDITTFLTDPLFAQQCFVMSEPLQAQKAGAQVQVFSVAEIGYNPYTTVLATSAALLRERPETAQAMVDAVREGWQAYLDNPAPTNATMHDLNPSMEIETFTEVAAAQVPYIQTDETSQSHLGLMTPGRWETLIAQLAELGDIPAPIPAQDCFQAL